MKKFIMVTVIAICAALCVAGWMQTVPMQEASAASPTPVVTAAQPETPEIKELITPEEEKAEATKPEPRHVITSALETIPEEMPAALEEGSVLESQPVPAPAPPQTVTDIQPGSTVYVPGFGWLETQGDGEVIYDKSIHENGNKIGLMG